MDKEKLTAEMAFRDEASAVIKIRQKLPDFLQSVKLKYVKLGYGYSCKPPTSLLVFAVAMPLLVSTLLQLTGLRMDRISDLWTCLLYTSPSPRDGLLSRMPSSA